MTPEYEYDENVFPLAYLITIRTYGTWLHGDERSSVDRHGKNIYGTPRVAPNYKMKDRMVENMKQPRFLLNENQREVVEETVVEVCENRGYALKAVNVRTNHFHSVVSADCKPKAIIHAFKSYATRNLRNKELVEKEKILWSRGKSRRYLWKPRHVSIAIDYVLYGQGDDLTEFDKLIAKDEENEDDI